jgi:hypothetical protein
MYLYGENVESIAITTIKTTPSTLRGQYWPRRVRLNKTTMTNCSASCGPRELTGFHGHFLVFLQAFGPAAAGLVNGVPSLADLGLLSFGLLGIVNFAMALYVGAFAIWILLDKFGINYWAALVLAPLLVGDASAW